MKTPPKIAIVLCSNYEDGWHDKLFVRYLIWFDGRVHFIDEPTHSECLDVYYDHPDLKFKEVRGLCMYCKGRGIKKRGE